MGDPAMCEACKVPKYIDGMGSLIPRPSQVCSHFAVRSELVASLPFYRRVASRSLRNPHEAEDVIQSFALKALERASQLREPLAARGWLWRLLNTTLLDHLRLRGRRGAREIRFDARYHDIAEDPVPSPDAELSRILTGALASLKPNYAEILVEVDLHERPTAEVAAQLGITMNNLAVRLHRARRSARRHVERMLG